MRMQWVAPASSYADTFPTTSPFLICSGGLVEYMCSGPVICMVWEGRGMVAIGRAMIGATNPQASAPGTFRGDFAIEVGRNIIHGR